MFVALFDTGENREDCIGVLSHRRFLAPRFHATRFLVPRFLAPGSLAPGYLAPRFLSPRFLAPNFLAPQTSSPQYLFTAKRFCCKTFSPQNVFVIDFFAKKWRGRKPSVTNNVVAQGARRHNGHRRKQSSTQTNTRRPRH